MIQFEDLIQIEQEIMDALPDMVAYEDAIILFDAEEIIELEVLPRTEALLNGLQQIIKANQAKAQANKDQMLFSLSNLEIVVLSLGIAILLLMIFAYTYIQLNITRPVLSMNQHILDLSVGKRTPIKLENGGTVIGEMKNAVAKLASNFEQTALFCQSDKRR